jgi:excisionase family DNA binding protein
MAMNSEARLYSLDQVAEQLGLHVRTVRGYVRSGRLKAVRIGKQYRVAREDLESMMGTKGPRSAVPRHRRAEVSSVVQVDAVSQETAQRITNHLHGAVKTPRDDGSALRVETIYDLGRAQMKVIVIGSLFAAANIFALLRVILED